MTDERSAPLRLALKLGRWIKDGWLMLGATLLTILIVEGGFRVWNRAFNQPPAAAPGPPSPFESTDWAADYWIGHEKEEAVEWAPYVYIRNPTFEAPHASTDELGHRITPLPELPDLPAGAVRPKFRIFFMGGSTIFGWYQRAEYTIPAEAARRMQSELGDDIRVDVTNFGVPGHTFTQEIIELMLQLRSGARPDVVVFYDGINDVMATVQNGEAGLPQNESNRAEDFERGRTVARNAQSGMGNDIRETARAAYGLFSRLHFVQAARAVRVRDARPPVPTEVLIRDSVRMYAENVRLVEALAEHYGFRPIYVWQPALQSTKKPLTAREAWFRSPSQIGELHEAIPKLLDAAVTPMVGDRFINAASLFDDDPLEVFVDWVGHTYERANPVIVDTMMPQLRAAAARKGIEAGDR